MIAVKEERELAEISFTKFHDFTANCRGRYFCRSSSSTSLSLGRGASLVDESGLISVQLLLLKNKMVPFQFSFYWITHQVNSNVMLISCSARCPSLLGQAGNLAELQRYDKQKLVPDLMVRHVKFGDHKPGFKFDPFSHSDFEVEHVPRPTPRLLPFFVFRIVFS